MNLDANGWPTCICGSGGQPVTFTRISTLLVLTRNYPPGQFVVLYDGDGTIQYSFDATKNIALSSPGRDVIDVGPFSAGIGLSITATDPNHTGNYIRNIRIVWPPYESLLASGERFNPVFVSRIKPFSVLRFMDWQQTNNSTEGLAWSERRTPSYAFWGQPLANDYDYTRSVPIEVMVGLANKMDADPWFNMPHKATDSYISEFAQLVHDELDSDRRVYVEYSNEVWNPSFQQYTYAENQGVALWPSLSATPWVANWNFYGMRSAQMCDIWKSVWGADGDRVTCVFGAHSGAVTSTPTALTCSYWTAGAPCADHGFSVVAIAPYFGYHVPDAWTADADGGLSKLFTEMNSGGLIPEPDGYPSGMIQEAIDKIAVTKSHANSWGLGLISYEAGQSLVHPTNATTTPLYIAANRDARIGTATASYFEKLQQASIHFVNYYNDAMEPSQYGSWGALESTASTTAPKYEALLNFINSTAPAYDTVAPSVPAGLSATVASSSQINLSWSASTDNTGVQGYRLFRNGRQIATASTTSYSDSSLSELTTYTYYVIGYDAEGNQSAQSSTISTTTSARVPILSGASPTGTLASGTSSTTLSVVTDINATCAYSTSPSTAFGSMTQFSTTGTTTHATTISGLSDSTAYSYYVKCQTPTGGTSAETTISFAVASGLVPTFVETGSLTFSGSTVSNTNVNFGSPNANRRVIVALAGIGFGRTITSATIGGVTATVHMGVSSGTGGTEWVGFISAIVPSNATGTISVTFNNGITSNYTYGLYTVDNSKLNSTTPATSTASTASGTSLAVSVNAQQGGFALGVTKWANGASKSPAVSGYTIDVNGNNQVLFRLTPILSTGTLTATTTWTGSFTGHSGVAMWR